MKTTRTEFLVTVAGGLAATALSPGRLLGAPVALDAAGFQALVGETFTFRGPGGREPAARLSRDGRPTAALRSSGRFRGF